MCNLARLPSLLKPLKLMIHQTPVASSFKLLAYALVLLRKGGYPCVFYGDMYGIRANVKDPMTPACDGKLPILTQARKRYAYGEQEDYFDQPNCIGPFFRSPLFSLRPFSLTTWQGSSATETPITPDWPVFSATVGPARKGCLLVDSIRTASGPISWGITAHLLSSTKGAMANSPSRP